jgi:predicted glycogen debranching enzyme
MGVAKQGPFSAFDQAVSSEYVAVSNSGAYSSSTICGANTRRYHALLAAPLREPPGVFVVLNTLEEVLDVAGARVFLSTNEFPGAIFPEGYKHLASFEMAPLPTFIFDFQGVRLRKTVCLAPDERTVVVAYELLSKRAGVTLEIRPFCSFRERHSLTEANVAAGLSASRQGDWVVFQPYKSLPALRMMCPCEFRPAPDWYRHFQYRRDRERGHSGQEDLVSPGVFKTHPEPGKPVHFMATLETNTGAAPALIDAAEATAIEWAKPARRFPELARGLAVGLRDFLVHRCSNELTVLRGLPWHAEWARHALMAIPGYLAIGRFVEAEGVLATWAARAKNGFLPRFVDDRCASGESDTEATLWFFEAVAHLLAHTKNYDWVRAKLLPFMNVAVDAVAAGRGPAKIAADGLVYSPGAGRTLAPRDGDAAFVEIQALYFNALKVMEELASHFRDDDARVRFQMAAKAVQRAHNKLMWDAYNHVPVDAYSAAGVDRTPRPMALLAVALSHPVLVRRRWEILVEQIESALLTPRGLLAVPPDVSGSRKFFPGDSYEQARRNGGIWPQFLGAFLVAHKKTFGKSPLHGEKFAEYFKPLADVVSNGLVNHVPEFFDSADPFTPRGVPADAASAGQLVWALTAKIDPRHYDPS